MQRAAKLKDEMKSDTCFQMIVCQAPFRSTERQAQHSPQSAYRSGLIQYSWPVKTFVFLSATEWPALY